VSHLSGEIFGSSNSSNNEAIYPGSFDPWTNGHYEILCQAAPLFRKITIAVAVNPLKASPLFTLEDRLGFIQDIIKDCAPKLSVDWYPVKGPGAIYTVNYAKKIGAGYIIRGLRNGTDFEQELAMTQVNHDLNPNVRTIFFTDQNSSHISSSMVRGLIGMEGWQDAVKKYIPFQMWPRFFELVDKQ
jgi:pantetheine-phosphate adenylyltransferase